MARGLSDLLMSRNFPFGAIRRIDAMSPSSESVFRIVLQPRPLVIERISFSKESVSKMLVASS